MPRSVCLEWKFEIIICALLSKYASSLKILKEHYILIDFDFLYWWLSHIIYHIIFNLNDFKTIHDFNNYQLTPFHSKSHTHLSVQITRHTHNKNLPPPPPLPPSLPRFNAAVWLKKSNHLKGEQKTESLPKKQPQNKNWKLEDV